jgi:hypothetical protein
MHRRAEETRQAAGEAEEEMTDLLVPVARRIPLALHGKVAGAFNGQRAAQEIGCVFGRSTRPKQPILLWGPDERSVMLIMGDGEAEAAELEDLAQAVLAKAQSNVDKTGRAVDFDALREKHGLMRREEVDAAVRDALRRRIAQHRANPVTDPFRQPEWRH